MNLSNRVAKSEQAAGCESGPCPLCERRDATQPRQSPPPGFVEEFLQAYELPCPRCGRAIVFRVVMWGRPEAWKEHSCP